MNPIRLLKVIARLLFPNWLPAWLYKWSRIDFTVNENSLGGSGGMLQAGEIAGAYTARLAKGAGTFDITFAINLTGYLRGNAVVASRLNVNYQLYATIVASGASNGTGQMNDPFNMAFTRADLRLFLDPNKDTTQHLPATAGAAVGLQFNSDDRAILSATSLVLSPSVGTLSTGTLPGGFGNFILVFDQPTIVVPDGTTYWPGLPSFALRAVIMGDARDVDLTTGMRGSVTFEFQSV